MIHALGMVILFITELVLLPSLVISADSSKPSTDISFDLFEKNNFPKVQLLKVNGQRELVYKIGNRQSVGKKELMIQCKNNGYPIDQCSLLWRKIRSVMYNPEGLKMVVIPELLYNLTDDAIISEQSNFLLECIPGNDPKDCLLNVSNEYALARSVFSSFSAKDILGMKRVVFVHSVLLSKEESSSTSSSSSRTMILESILNDMKDNGLLAEAQAIFVINYGLTMPSEIVKRYPTVTFIDGGRDTARFEIPTLQLLYYFARLSKTIRLNLSLDSPAVSGANEVEAVAAGTGGGTGTRTEFLGVNGDVSAGAVTRNNINDDDQYQILYVHTKGVSAENEIIPVRDWRRLMSFFTISQHRLCQRFLNTGKYDAVGVNLLETPKYPWQEAEERNWHFSGNYWWARADHVAALPALSVNRNLKYDGEFWIGSTRSGSDTDAVRLLSLHNSGISHYKHAYPIERYEYAVNVAAASEFR